MSKSTKKPSAVTVTASAEVLAAKVFEAVQTGLQFDSVRSTLTTMAGVVAEQYGWLRAHGVEFDKAGKSKCPHRAAVKRAVAELRPDATEAQRGKIVSAFIVCYTQSLPYNPNPSQAKKREQAKKGPKQPGSKAPANGTNEPTKGENTDPTKTTDNPHGLSVEQLEMYKAFIVFEAAMRKNNQYTIAEETRDRMLGLAWFPKIKVGQAK